ncbi:penicillin acylase family protein [Salinarchaeum chitinilyticum]
MVADRTRRAVLGAALGGGIAATAVPQIRRYLRQFAPLSGGVWEAARRDVGGDFSSPYGDATIRKDEFGVPHVEAESEQALAYATGYVHGVDRLFQMDLVRRQMRGTLSAVAGSATVETDEFHRRMDFTAAAEATVERLEGTETEPIVEAYVEGVNLARRREGLPIEFRLLEYEPDPWTTTDVMLVEKQIAWALTGNFRPLERAVVADEFGEATVEALYPERMDHDTPILRDRELASGSRDLPAQAASSSATTTTSAVSDTTGGSSSIRAGTSTTEPTESGSGDHRVGPELAAWCSQFTSPDGVGSNSWLVAGEHTADGEPIVCNDPHLTLMAPPVWYEQHLDCPEFETRGVAFPGAPFVVIGENQSGAWGFTNVGADVCDHYSYETDGEGRYRYGDEWREFETEKVTIEVDGGSDRTIERRKTVHGPVVEEADQEVAVAWTGLAGTETFAAVRDLAHSEGLADTVAALRRFDAPTQNFVYADTDGNTLYWTTGRVPIRGNGPGPGSEAERVRGDRVFDGSAKEGEWSGFDPYGTPSWDGFVPFEDKPGLVNPDYVATANQRVVDDPGFYLGDGYAPPFRGARAYERLDAAVADGSIDVETMVSVQQDVRDRRAELLVPELLDVREQLSEAGDAIASDLEDWDRRMRAGSAGALAFDQLLDAFREIVFGEPYEDAGLEDSPLPNDWILLTLPADAPWFDRDAVPARTDALVEAAERAAESIDGKGREEYGDVNRLGIDHPLGVGFLGYDAKPAEGSEATLKNVRVNTDVGSSWRMIAPPNGDSQAILPGGNSGDYFSEHYDDQLSMWFDGEYKPMDRTHRGSTFATFDGGGGRSDGSGGGGES